MINIQDIIPFMKDGWVAMDKNKCWYWHRRKPTKLNSPWNYWDSKGSDFELLMFKIAPADDWTKSLIKIDNTAREKFEEEYQNNIQRTIQELRQND